MAKAAFRLPISDTIISSWQKINGVKTTFWCNFAILFVVIAIHNALVKVTIDSHPAILAALCAIILIVYIFMNAGLYYLGIERAKGSNLTPGSILKIMNLHTLLHLLGLLILQTVVVLIPALLIFLGLQLFIYPSQFVNFIGILVCITGTISFLIVILRLSLSIAFIVDRNERPAKAVILSCEATKGNLWNLIGFYYMLLVLLVAGLLTLIAGIIWTLPLFFIAYGNMYLQLANKNT